MYVQAFLPYFPYTYLRSTYIPLCTIMNSSLVYTLTMWTYSTLQQSRIIEEHKLLGGICTMNVVLRGSTQSRYSGFYTQDLNIWVVLHALHCRYSFWFFPLQNINLNVVFILQNYLVFYQQIVIAGEYLIVNS